ncbi:hypothetical protein CSC62_14110 [Pseudoxanthomonas jiangsuensis]|uniref:hypothetical protein n=1 Tax=Pseudoxanthomonas jiangsuensis TaxID=619688 RepID=UPI001391A028|nr:hypothetical protein [Pseudoxanthomonas jiangsuensis]KAF1692764.1 hypothetical protein CSC62_14110 [Pseudoxanthomonas jiangsuensis]
MSKLILTAIDTITRPVTLRLPTQTAGKFQEGTINVQARIKTKDELTELADRGLTDLEYIDSLVVSVDGLGDANGNAITGEAALHEVKHGRWSTYLTTAIIQDYFEQFGDARAKNSKPSRGR